jgi:hypothetical protein
VLGVLRMRRSTWALVAGLAVAGIVLAVGTLRTQSLQAQADKARAARELCEPTAAEKAAALAEEQAKAPALAGKDPIDPNSPLGWMFLGGHFDERVRACYAKHPLPDEAINAPEKKGRSIAKIVAILGAIPWVWSFLLRRIAEVGAAFGGKPPTY